MDGAWQVQQVVFRAARCSDLSDIAGLAALFTDDGVVDAGGHTATGRDAIFEFFGGASAKPAETERTKHVVTNCLVDTDGDALVVTSYFQVLRSWGTATWGRYVDSCVRDGDQWRIAHRSVVVDGTIERPAAPAP